MAFSTLVSYIAGLGFLRWTDDRRRRLCLVVPIVVDLRCSASSSTPTFCIGHAARSSRARSVPMSTMPHLDIILPIGISFYTFHTITYIVDSYRRRRSSRRGISSSSAAYVSLFSQLVAGPIVRFRQIERTSRTSAAPIARAGCDAAWSLLHRRPGREGGDRRQPRRVRRSGAGALHDRCRRSAPGWRCSATPSSSTSISPATATWRSGWLHVRPADSAELQLAVQGARSVRLLAALAHLAVACLRDYLYIPLGGNRARRVRDLPQPDAHHADRRPVARRQLDVRRLGRLSRHAAVRSTDATRRRVGSRSGVRSDAGDMFVLVV